jgi:heme/copper-type cytochrome/quinol oxidase subunit 2
MPLKTENMRSSITSTTITILIVISLIVSPAISYSSLPALTNDRSNEAEIFTTDASPYGLTYGEWTARWWQWAYSVPRDVHPAYDDSGKYCAEGQGGPVWFLTGTYEHPVERYCNIPAGKAILFPILNSECSYVEFPGLNTEEELRQCAKQMQDSVVHLEASIDGVPISGLEQYRVQSTLFNLTLGQNNILDLPANTNTQAISDGNWVFLKPLSPGEHVIYFKGGLEARNITTNNNNSNNSSNSINPFAGPYGWDNPVTYHVTISDNSSSTSTIVVQNQTEREIAYKNPIVSVLANDLENRINKSGAILEITSKLQEVKSAPFASSISPELNGIPKDVDMPKRNVAQDILNTDKDFEVIFFLMPNGDMYLEEPYSRQENLTTNNFAFRDYYKGAVGTRSTYLGNVIISASSGLPQANIAVPVYSENNGTLVGVWAGGLNLTNFSRSLQSLNLTNNERIVYVDQQGQKIADSNNRSISRSNSLNESFADLQSFRNAINGGSGTMIEIINGIKMVVSYHPVRVFSAVWAVLFMEPYEDRLKNSQNYM